MTDREKVIKALECCTGYCCEEIGCPYFDTEDDCEEKWRDDAITLLKAQEPLVMTWEEAQANVNEEPELHDSTETEIDYLDGVSNDRLEGCGEVRMTKHKAIEILEEVKTLDDSMFAYSQAYNDALEMAIEALKTQEPVEPKMMYFVDEGLTWEKYEVPTCGVCGALLGDALFCPMCGRAVKWE